MAGANALRALPDDAETGRLDTFLVHPETGKGPRLDVLEVVARRTGVLGVLNGQSGVITFRTRSEEAARLRYVLTNEIGLRVAA